MDVHVFYDDTFKRQFGPSSKTRIDAVFAVSSVIFSHSSLKTIVDPVIKKYTYLENETIKATDHDLRYISVIFKSFSKIFI